MKLNSAFWILVKSGTSGRVLPETLERTRAASYAAGANSLDTTIADLRENGWKASKVVLVPWETARPTYR
jgi:hypothetical protein